MKTITKQQVLLVEDDLSMAKLIQLTLKSEPFEFFHVANGTDALAFLEKQIPQVVLLDLNLPDINGMQILKHINENKFPLSVIIISAHGTVNTAVEAIQLGALDFLEKPFSAERLLITIKNALERQNLSDTVDTLKKTQQSGFCQFIGSSAVMHSLYHTIENVASSKASVLITGESGTGKEICAKAIHDSSSRKDAPFVAINCAAISDTLIESEMFGHTKGAFTGATSSRDGAMASASGGTLFLDEICEMDFDLQAKLLRAIQMEEIKKLGSDKVEKINIRIISATNRDPLAEIKQGRFREDLYYRLNVIPILLPPLNERGNDVIELANAFIKEISKAEDKHFAGMLGKTEEYFHAYSWPGNIRELRNVIHSIIVMHNEDMISPDMLPSSMDSIKEENPFIASDPKNPVAQVNQDGTNNLDRAQSDKPLWLIEKEHIEEIIANNNGNIPKAAAVLDVNPSTIYRKIQSWKNI